LAGVAILILGLFIGRSNPADFLFFQIATITPQPSPTLEPAPGATRTRETDGMVVVYVPAGPFIMGSNDGDKDEKPEHTATTAVLD
jgi:formylglycine-generating enzyme required for sulfatase activity